MRKAVYLSFLFAFAVFSLPTFAQVVSNTNSTGTGSLEDAIIFANSATSPVTITFDIPGSGPHIIEPVAGGAFTAIGAPFVFIDGSSQPAGDIILSGLNASTSANGLEIYGFNSAVKGLTIEDFAGSGIFAGANATSTILEEIVSSNNLRGYEMRCNNGLFFDCIADNNILVGFDFAGGGIFVDMCTAIDNGETGFLGSNQSGMVVLNCTATGNDEGIVFFDAPEFTVEGSISGTTTSGNVSTGIAVVKSTTSAMDGLIFNNTIENNDVGVHIEPTLSPDVEISENQINCNITSGISRGSGTYFPSPPSITSVTTDEIQGITETGSIVEVFINTDCSALPCQGKTFLVSEMVDDGMGNPTSNFAIDLSPFSISAGDLLTLSATINFNTSEFSSCAAAGVPCPSANPVIVTNNNDSGDESLRWAIECITNNSALTDIEFSIGTGDQQIDLLTELPAISKANAFIDGSTQPGGKITIDGGLISPPTGSGLLFTGSNQTVYDLKLNGFQDHGIFVDFGADFFIGENLMSENNSGNGIYINNVDDPVVKASEFSNNLNSGVVIEDANNITLDNITTDKNDFNGVELKTVDIGTVTDVLITESDHTGLFVSQCISIGFTDIDTEQSIFQGIAIEDSDLLSITNLTSKLNGTEGVEVINSDDIIFDNAIITGNGGDGMYFEASDNFLVENSQIGDAPSVVDGPNALEGIVISDGGAPPVGGTIQTSTIAGNTTGIHVLDVSGTNPEVLITDNSIFCNSTIGILRGDGLPVEPTITKATNTLVEGTALSGAEIEIFLVDNTDCISAPEQGKSIINSTTVTANGSGFWSFSPSGGIIFPGDILVATSTFTGSNTSQFSVAATVTLACPGTNPVIVRNDNDSGDESLRWAIECVNGDVNLTEIDFDVNSGGDQTISLSTALPTVFSDPVFIDGSTQPGGQITVDGSGFTSGFISGLIFTSSNASINDIAIENFPAAGIEAVGTVGISNFSGDNLTLKGNGVSGMVAIDYNDVTITNSDLSSNSEVGFEGLFVENLILDNVICSNSLSTTGLGISLEFTENSQVLNCTTNSNSTDGVSAYFSNDLTIDNLESKDNISNGIYLDDCDAFLIENSQIGDEPGVSIGGNGTNGILIEPGTTSGLPSGQSTDGTIQFNTIVGNNTGVRVLVPDPSGTLIDDVFISENSISCNSAGGIIQEDGDPPTPTITSAFPSGITGTSGISNAIIELFINDDSNCVGDPAQGKTFVSFVTADGSGNWSASSAGFSLGDEITVTATAPDTRFNTSAFSAAMALAPPPCEVDSSFTNVTCFDGLDGTATANIISGSAPFVFSWSHGPTTQTVTGLTAGTYSVTVTTDGGTCTDFTSVVISEPDSIQLDLSKTDVTCFGGNDGTVSSNVTGGTPSYTYNWSDGSTGTNLINVPAGMYYLTITDSEGCMNIDSIEVFEPDQIILGKDSTNVACFGESTGEAEVILSGLASISWSNGATTALITGLSAGTYTVTVSVGNCVETESFNIEEAPEIITSTGKTDFTCFNDGTGEVTVTASGGTGTLTFLWSAPPPNVGANIFVPTGGKYFVTVTDGNGCTKVDSVTVFEPDSLQVSILGTDVDCFGADNGAATANATGGDPTSYNYIWNPSSAGTGQTISGLAPGLYEVTVNDVNLCEDTASVIISEPDSIQLDLSKTDVTCFGGSDGTVSSNATGGTPSYTYNWSDGSTGTNLTNVPAGMYYLTITDSEGCMNIDSIEVFEPAQLILGKDSTNVACFGASTGEAEVILSGSASVSWSNGGTTALITGLSAGTYTVTVSVGNCVETESFNIEEAPEIISSTGKTDFTCFNDGTGAVSVSATGGTGTLTFLWSAPPPNVGATIFVPTGGKYFVTATDGNGCTKVDSATVFEPDSLQVSILGTDVDCFGADNGAATANATGGDPSSYNYLWNPSSAGTGQTISGLASGLYEVTVNDVNLCEDTASVMITEAPKIITSISSTEVSCFGFLDGEATVNVSGTASNYSYLWSNSGTSQTISGIPSGNYTVTVTEDSGGVFCEDTMSVLINQPDTLVASTTGTDITCFGDNDGEATASATGGSGSYSFLWNTGATDFFIENLSPGTYEVTISDLNGCEDTSSVQISEPLLFSATILSQDITCFGFADGTASSTTTNGILPFNYLWSNSATTQDVNNLAPGGYSLLITDANGCEAMASTTINEPAALGINFITEDVTCFEYFDGSIEAIGSGGIPPYDYSWSNGSSSDIIVSLDAGTYTLTLEDANGCELILNETVSQPDEIIIDVSTTDESCFGAGDGEAEAMASGGVGNYFYVWSDNQVGPIATGLSNGTYEIEAIDDDGCFALEIVDIFSPTEIEFSVSSTDETSFMANDGTATVSNVTGGFSPYTYLWSNGMTSPTVADLVPGNYQCTITDSTGCFVIASASIQAFGCGMAVDTLNGQNVSCFGGADGSLTVAIIGGIAPITYSWSNGSNTATISGLTTGTYNVTVTDATGCVVTDSGTVTEPDSLIASATNTQLSSFGGNDGTATASGLGGTPPFNYLWSNGETTQTITGLTAGTYDVQVIDENGCTDNASVIIPNFNCTFEADSIEIVSSITCAGLSDGSAAPRINSGSTPFSYLWSNGSTDSLLTRVPAGTYSVTITDNTNCSDTLIEVINEPLPLSLDVSTTDETLNNGNDGTATPSISGGTAPYTYNWSNGQSTETATGLAPGVNYSVTCTDENGCMIEETGIMIQEYNCTFELAASSSSDVTCFGLSDGTATANVLSGTAPFIYNWNTGGTSEFISGLSEGNYSVTATDATNCADTVTVSISQPDSFFVDISIVNESSNGGENGSITALASGGTPTYNFEWSNGGNTPSINNLPPGNYTLSCTDANGCRLVLENNEVESFNCDLRIDSLQAADAECFNGTDGTLTPFLSGETNPVSYEWSNGSTNTILSGAPAGTYLLRVIDAVNCIDSIQGTINEPSEITLNLISTNESSAGGNDGSASVNPTGGTPNYTITWSTGESGLSIENLMPGRYTVSLTDENGCEKNESFNIQAFGCDLIIDTILVNPVSCFGSSDGVATPVLQGGSPAFQFNWSNGSSDSSLLNVVSGDYSISVTDSNNCFDSMSVFIPEPTELLANLIRTDETGVDLNDGTAMVAPSGGTMPFDIFWSNGEMTSSVSGLSPGTYSVSIIDNNGCEVISDTRILPFDCNLRIDSLVASDVDCFGNSNGNIESYVSGGVGMISFEWNGVSNTQNISGLDAGTFILNVVDNLGCFDSDTAFVFEPTQLSIDSFRAVSLDCFGDMDAAVQSFTTGGVMPYSFTWNTGSNIDNIAGLPSGNYILTLTDANNCFTVDSIEILEPDELILNVSKTDETAANASDGTATASASGGTGLLTYNWSNGEMSASVSGLAPGSYQVSVTDENGCEKIGSVIINAFGSDPCDLIIDTLIIRNVNCFGEANGNITPVLAGGTTPFNFTWSNMTSDSVASNLTIGQYILNVIDAEGCTAVDTGFVDEPDSLFITLVGTDETVLNASDGTAQATAVGGVPPVTWSWNTGESDALITGLSPNTYTVTGTDANGCEASGTITILQGRDTSGCLTSAGEMDPEFLTTCGIDTAFAINIGNPVLETDDVLEYILHDRPDDQIGRIFQRSEVPNFGYSTNMEYNKAYFISAVAGNADSLGNVDLTDPCLSVIAGQPVLFEPLPQPIYAIQGPNLVCGNEPFYLITNDLYNDSNVNYFWSLPTGETKTTSESEFKITPGTEAHTGDYIVYRDSAGCRSLPSAPFFVEVAIYPDGSIDAGEDQFLCDGRRANINVISNLSQSGQWNSLGFATVVSHRQENSEVVDLQAGSNLFVWEVPLGDCQSAGTDTVNIVVEQAPILIDDYYTLRNAGDAVKLDILENDMLSGVIDTTLNLLNDPAFGEIQWKEEEGAYYFILDEAQRGNIEIDYEVCNTLAVCGTGCATGKIFIEVKSLPVLPEGITPNGDNLNDYLFIRGIQGFQRIEVLIANRWGDIVYENDNYSNNDPWFGTRQSTGESLPQGAYYYVVKAFENGVQVEGDFSGLIHIFN